MSNQIEIVAILTPTPGFVERAIEALAPFSKYVEENERGVLRYEMYRQVNFEEGNEQLVVIELFKDEEALELHRMSSPYKAILEKAAKEQLLLAPPDVKIIQRAGGFALRGSE